MAGPTLSPLLIASFDSALHRVPQKGSLLKESVTIRDGVVGEDHRFPAKGKAVARTRAALQPIQSGPTIKAKPKAELEPREHYEFLDEYEIAQTNVSAMAGYAMDSRDAVERACDQWIINALATINTDAIGTAIAQDSAAVRLNTIESLVPGYTALLARGCGPGDMLTFAYNQQHFTSIVEVDQLVSRDYSDRGMIATGRPPPLFGMKWVGIEDRPEEGGISTTQGWMFAKRGVGLAMGNVRNMRVIDWRSDLQSWQIGAKLLGGATAIDRNMIAPRLLKLT